MSAKLFLILACAMFAVAAARHVRDVAAQPAQTDNFQQLFDSAKSALETIQKDILDALQVKSPEELKEKTIAQGKEAAETLDVLAGNINKKTQSFQTTVNQALEDLKAKHPETAADIESNVDKVKKGAEDVFSKLKDLGNSDTAAQIKDTSMKLLGETMDTLKNLIHTVQESAKKDSTAV